MKKINFSRAHQVLSEKEMKNVLGGSGGCNKKSCSANTDCPNSVCANWGGSGPCQGKYCL